MLAAMVQRCVRSSIITFEQFDGKIKTVKPETEKQRREPT